MVFFDFQKAYDTVDREILFRILRHKQILTEQEIKILSFIYHNLRIRLSDE